MLAGFGKTGQTPTERSLTMYKFPNVQILMVKAENEVRMQCQPSTASCPVDGPLTSLVRFP